MLQRLRQQPIRWLTLLASLEVVALVLSVKCALHLRYLGDAASLLQETLDEEEATDQALTKIAMSVVNQEAEAA